MIKKIILNLDVVVVELRNDKLDLEHEVAKYGGIILLLLLRLTLDVIT